MMAAVLNVKCSKILNEITLEEQKVKVLVVMDGLYLPEAGSDILIPGYSKLTCDCDRRSRAVPFLITRPCR